MILLVHLLFGAAIGSAVKNIPLAIILAFLGHYFLDSIPHVDYSTEITEKTQLRKKLFVVLKVALDFCLGILLISIFSNPALPAGRQAIIYVCALVALIPDGLTALNNLLPRSGNPASQGFLATLNKILEFHRKFHIDKVHFLHNNKKISKFWRVATQIVVVLISVFLLKF